MAGTLALNVEILGEFKNLTKATQGAEKQLSGINKVTKGISTGMVKSLAAIGVGFSLNAISQQFQKLTKATIDDRKSQELLAIAMLNTGKATQVQIDQAEKLIGKMQVTSAVADDDLRPAFQKLFIATGDVTKSNRYLQIALDTSAATGKDLDAVTQAMSRALAGNDTALNRLIPSLKGTKDPLAELERTFKGAAEAAADLDPYQRMEIVMGEIDESIGAVLLPTLEKFSDWFVTILPDIQNFSNGLLKALDDPRVKKSIDTMMTSLGNLGLTIGTLFGSTETDEAKGFMNFWIVLTGVVESVATALNALIAPINAAFGNTKSMENWLDTILNGIVGIVGSITGMTRKPLTGYNPIGKSRPSPTPKAQNVTININKGNVTAQEIADKINRGNRATGTNLIRLQ
jgi:hypothetical protein